MEVLNTKQPYTAWGRPSTNIGPEGEKRYWDWSLNPVVDETGNVNHLVLSWNDASERERAKIELQKAYGELENQVRQRTSELSTLEEMFEMAAEAANMGAWIWDLATGKMLWSKYRKRLFGIEPDREVTLGIFMERLIPEDRDRVTQAIQEAIETRTDYDLEMRIEGTDGIRWFRTRGRGYYDDTGKPVHLAGMAWDITDSRRVRERD